MWQVQFEVGAESADNLLQEQNNGVLQWIIHCPVFLQTVKGLLHSAAWMLTPKLK